MNSPQSPNQPSLTSPGKVKTLAAYAAMIAVAGLAFVSIRAAGANLETRPSLETFGAESLTSHAQVNTLLHVLLALTAIIVTTRIMGSVFGWLQQPPVIGEVIGGIMLGPSLLGYFAPEAYAYLLPPSVSPFLGIIAQIGIILYMFLVGMELDLKVIARSGHATLAISHASIVVPFLLGASLALALYPSMGRDNVDFTVFALFIGVSMSVTAFPVLARILTDRGIHRTGLGTIALTCAAIDDVTAWCLLAFVVSIAEAKISGAVMTFALTLAFIAFVFVCVMPLMRWLIPRLEASPELSKNGMAIIFVGMLLSALATEYIGIHAIFGAFLLGAVVPHKSRIAVELSRRLESVVTVLFLPAFFAFTGMRIQIDLISGAQDWLICGGIILVASLGKFGGSFAAARLTGLDWRNSSALAILMNTRGLVELIVLNIGLDLKIIGPRLFAMLVIMALATTFMTTPILHLLLRNHPWRAEGDAPEPSAEPAALRA